ncbi:hypothetical protein NXC14_PA00468 (plasmid) [Rhizobium sp. NXC14]|nr:hypothetical protein NXC14_PA00468 [Rhizobium sp. NXC14]
MGRSVEQLQRSRCGAGEEQNLTSIRTAENGRKSNTAPGLGVASSPAIQVRSAVVDPCSTTAAFSSVFDCGLATARQSGSSYLLLISSAGQATDKTKNHCHPSSSNRVRQKRPK